MPEQFTPQEEHILQHSFEEMSQVGVRSFTVDALAEKLGMSKKTIYKFFPTKEALIEKSVTFFLSVVERKFRKIRESNLDPASKFVELMEFIIKQARKVPIEKVADLKIRYPDVWGIIVQFRLSRRDDFHAILKEAQESGLVRPEIDVDIAATLYINIINSTFLPEFFIDNDLPVRETGVTFLKMVTGGLFTEQGIKNVQID
ncbi:MAG: TetR/AcrR family transcriptional regulator [Candidatus Neomarinimicrobiota bacterium]|nr:TetR/AcrR family transcriptional regulator [Candidatus Neomarinimicrobiota bacterium]